MPMFSLYNSGWIQARLICGDIFALAGIVLYLSGYTTPVGLVFGLVWYAIAFGNYVRDHV